MSESGVDYAAVSTTGVEATGRLLLQQRYMSVAKTMLQLAGHTKPNNAAAQDQKIS